MRDMLVFMTVAALSGCAAHSSPFVGYWVADGATFNDVAPHHIELDLNKDGTYTGQNAFVTSRETFRGEGIWKETSPVDAVGIDRIPGEPLLLWLKNDVLTLTSRAGTVRFQRRT